MIRQVWMPLLLFVIRLAFVKLAEFHSYPTECSLKVDNICYKFVTLTETYNNAEKYCEMNDGQLISVKNRTSWMKISEKLSASTATSSSIFWVGLTDKKSPGQFTFRDGSNLRDLSFNFWSPEEPKNYYCTGCDCVFTHATNPYWSWAVTECHHRYYFICEYEAKPCQMLDVTVENADFQSCFRSEMVPYGTKINITCWQGYRMEGESEIMCIDRGIWTKMPRCIQSCSKPPQIAGSQIVSAIKEYYNVDDVVSYICNPGYFVNDKSPKTHFQIRCSGKWPSIIKGCTQQDNSAVNVINFLVGEDISLNCPVNQSTNYEALSWVWMKNDMTIVQGKFSANTDGTLTIVKSGPSDEGIYVCLLESNNKIEAGALSYKLRMKVHCSTLKTLFEELYFQQGESIKMKCTQTESKAVKWHKNGERIWSSRESRILLNGDLLIRNATAEDAGFYWCQTMYVEVNCERNITYQLYVNSTEEIPCGLTNDDNKHPWLVVLWWQEESIPFCYGSLIGSQWVVTSAYCFAVYQRKKETSVYVQLSKVFENSHESSVRLAVESVKIHPRNNRRLFINDIALIKLKKKIDFNREVLPLCLTELDTTRVNLCHEKKPVLGHVPGFGSLTTDDVQEMEFGIESMNIVPVDNCRGFGNTLITDNMFCTKSINETNYSASYAGDNGSPFTLLHQDRVHLVGIYSWGERSSFSGKFDYFTKVMPYYKWIFSVIKEDI